MMRRYSDVDSYINAQDKYKDVLEKLRALLSTTELVETVKWGMPTYTINGKNVVGMSAFKNHAGVWFFQGALLKDHYEVLINAQEGKTKALRQWRFQSIEEINDKKVLEYVDEAIKNEKQGKKIPISRNAKWEVPTALKEALKNNKKASEAFENLTKGRQKEFAEYISSAKREATVASRIQKIIPMIESGIGLNDKYR